MTNNLLLIGKFIKKIKKDDNYYIVLKVNDEDFIIKADSKIDVNQIELVKDEVIGIKGKITHPNPSVKYDGCVETIEICADAIILLKRTE